MKHVKKEAPTIYQQAPEIKPGQSIELLKELHILTRDGKLNQDSRRKLKQVYHLVQFIEPLLKDVGEGGERPVSVVDHGAGKSYLGFILYDLFFKGRDNSGHIYGIETREELVQKSTELAARLGFAPVELGRLDQGGTALHVLEGKSGGLLFQNMVKLD